MSAMAMELPGFVSTEEAAELLGFSSALVRRYIREGRLEAKIFGDRIYAISCDSLEKFQAIPRKRGNPNFQKRRD